MELEQARQIVLDACGRLVRTGLIARTWGNISCRLSDAQFLITPSGKAYDLLTEQDLVAVNLADLGYEGNVKPSSEKGIHAEVYRQKPQMNFVIHTHQPVASAASVLGSGIAVLDERAREIIGERVELAAYGLPGTKKLKKGVAEALRRTTGKAVLMARHGALCYGQDHGEAFAVADALERECARFLIKTEESGLSAIRSRREGNGLVFATGGQVVSASLDGVAPELPDSSLAASLELHRAVYRSRPDAGVIIQSALPNTFAVSKLGGTRKPLLDDFAQIVGTSLRTAAWDQSGKTVGMVLSALRGRNAALLQDNGALILAADESDAGAVETILEKGCMAYLAANAAGKVRPIGPLDCALMRFVYLTKYSKMSK